MKFSSHVPAAHSSLILGHAEKPPDEMTRLARRLSPNGWVAPPVSAPAASWRLKAVGYLSGYVSRSKVCRRFLVYGRTCSGHRPRSTASPQAALVKTSGPSNSYMA